MRARCLVAATMLAVGVAVGACGSDVPTGPTATSQAPRPGGGLTADQRRRADQLISIFENGTPTVQYGYAEDLHDGRGVTAGRAGYTTNDGDALRVIQAYTDLAPGNGLARFAPALRQLADTGGGDLPEADYIAAWKQAADDPAFRRAQDDQVEQNYFTPAMAAADRLGLTTPLARAELYDAAIQHGHGADPDGLPALIDRATARAGKADEAAWLTAFLDVRADDLRNPANADTKEEWSKSTDRVECFRRIAATGDYTLAGPLTVTAYGAAYTLA
ncbi:chitosanase [Kutzneria sp. NPDC051319]|uniref:chitosanase n=1 Tax=Kutzneria sp. NPDC051319 TaxID=3155047 RepID=UPI0034481B7B